MFYRALLLLALCLPLPGCGRNELEKNVPQAEHVEKSLAPDAPPAPLPREMVKLEISAMGIDDVGHLRVTVENHTSVPLDLVNITWNFFRKTGELITNDGFPLSVLTTQPLGSDSSTIPPGQSKIFTNPLIPVTRIFRETPIEDVDTAGISIYISRDAFSRLNLGSDIKSDEVSIRQVFQSSRFLLRSSVVSGSDPTPERASRDLERKPADYSTDARKSGFKVVDTASTPSVIRNSGKDISFFEKEKLTAIYDTSLSRRDAVDKALSHGKAVMKVSQQNGEASKLEAALEKQGWHQHTVTHGIREEIDGGYLYRLEVVSNAVDYYVVLKADKSFANCQVVHKSEGSPW